MPRAGGPSVARPLDALAFSGRILRGLVETAALLLAPALQSSSTPITNEIKRRPEERVMELGVLEYIELGCAEGPRARVF